MFFIKEESKPIIESSIDEYSDSFARDVSLDELREVRSTTMPYVLHFLTHSKIFKEMPSKFEHTFSPSGFRTELAEHDHDLADLPGSMFEGLLLYAGYQTSNKSNGATPVTQPRALGESEFRMENAVKIARFAGAEITTDLADEGITHVLVGNDKNQMKILREKFSRHVFSRLLW